MRNIAIAFAMVGLWTAVTQAAEHAGEQEAEHAGEQQQDMQVLKASETIDMTVVNDEAEQLGEIYDLVVSPDGRRVSQVVVSAGGFLGLGDKLLPVPIGAVKFIEQSEKDEEWVAKIDIDKERLKNAPSMEGDGWGDLTEPKWSGELNAYYNVERKEENAREVRKVSELIGMPIRNEASEDADNVGEVNEIVFETSSGTIRYAAMSFGGWLGIGDKLFAVPWDHISFARSAGDDAVQYLTLTEDISKDALQAAEGFNADDWPAKADESWLSGNRSRPKARVAKENEERQR